MRPTGKASSMENDTYQNAGNTLHRIYFGNRLFSGSKTSLEDAKVGATATMDAHIAHYNATDTVIDNWVVALGGVPDNSTEYEGLTYNSYSANGQTWLVPDGEEATVIAKLEERITEIAAAITQLNKYKTDVSSIAAEPEMG